jgi:hypothetical protein
MPGFGPAFPKRLFLRKLAARSRAHDVRERRRKAAGRLNRAPGSIAGGPHAQHSGHYYYPAECAGIPAGSLAFRNALRSKGFIGLIAAKSGQCSAAPE